MSYLMQYEPEFANPASSDIAFAVATQYLRGGGVSAVAAQEEAEQIVAQVAPVYREYEVSVNREGVNFLGLKPGPFIVSKVSATDLYDAYLQAAARYVLGGVTRVSGNRAEVSRPGFYLTGKAIV